MTDKCTEKYRVVALGNFDGLHAGHMTVLNQAKSVAATDKTACVAVFDEHSLKILGGTAPKMLMPVSERDCIFAGMSFEICVLNFSEIKNFTCEEFVEEILIKRLNASEAVCGFNYRFGRGALGDARTLNELCSKKGIKCIVVDEVDVDGKTVSSTAVRSLVESGEIELANKMLGRNFGFSSKVISGDKRARQFGFPTINQAIPEELVRPKFGVYASKVQIDGEVYDGVTNIGRRPTVGTDIVLSETHILDFNGDIYGKTVKVKLLRYMRKERKFDSFDELFRQIKSDVSDVRMG